MEDCATGKSMKDMTEKLYGHEKILDKYRKASIRYEKKPKTDEPNFAIVEIAYWIGRVEALKRFLSNNKRDIPAFFSPYVLKPRSNLKSMENTQVS